MPTRRQILLGAISAPLSRGIPSFKPGAGRTPEILSESHCLSRESAIGFRLLLQREAAIHSGFRYSTERKSVTILPAARQLTRESAQKCLQRILNGGWLILETGLCFSTRNESRAQIDLLNQVFGIPARDPVVLPEEHRAGSSRYVDYDWPCRTLVRGFERITPVGCLADEVIARFSGIPVCSKHFIGSGGVIFLGSMLGPGLFAGEREAYQAGAGMLSFLQQRRL